MWKIVAFILTLGVLALVFALCVSAQDTQPAYDVTPLPIGSPAPLPKYDMNGDGVVNVQDVNGFGEALSAGYFTVQDINPFMREVNAAKAEMTVTIGIGGAIYTDSSIDIIDGLDPDGHYIVCRGLVTSDGVQYAVGIEGRLTSLAVLSEHLGTTIEDVTIIVVPSPATQPTESGGEGL